MTTVARKTIIREGGEATALEITFCDGEKISAHLGDFSPAIQSELLAHGLAQKLGDSYSGADGNARWAREQAEKTLTALLSGEWNRKGGGGGGSSDLVEALTGLVDQPLDVVEARVADMSAADRKALSAQPRVKAALARIKAERLARKAGQVQTPFDLGSLFAGGDDDE